MCTNNHGDGRIVLNDGTRFQFKITDHLGNTVVLFEDKDEDDVINSTATDPAIAEVLQRNLYYPFGLGLEGEWADETTPEMKYLYNGKELNSDFGLDWIDYGARYYDAAIAWWNAVDPMAETMASWSSYNYTFNNPIRFIDPDGTTPEAPPTLKQAITTGMKSKRFISLMKANGITAKNFNKKISIGKKSKITPGEGKITIQQKETLGEMVFALTHEMTNLKNEGKLKQISDDTKALKNTPEQYADKVLAVEAGGIVNKAIVANEIDGIEPEKGVAKYANMVKEGKLTEEKFSKMILNATSKFKSPNNPKNRDDDPKNDVYIRDKYINQAKRMQKASKDKKNKG